MKTGGKHFSYLHIQGYFPWKNRKTERKQSMSLVYLGLQIFRTDFHRPAAQRAVFTLRNNGHTCSKLRGKERKKEGLLNQYWINYNIHLYIFSETISSEMEFKQDPGLISRMDHKCLHLKHPMAKDYH